MVLRYNPDDVFSGVEALVAGYAPRYDGDDGRPTVPTPLVLALALAVLVLSRYRRLAWWSIGTSAGSLRALR